MEELRAAVESLRAADHRVDPRLTFEGGDATRMARDAASQGADLIIAAGGDGTLNEVVNGVAGEDWEGAVAVVPLGTANDFALELGIPEDVRQAMEVAVHGEDRTVDVGKLNDRHFINVSTGGVAATATGETPSETKRFLGPLAYLLTGVQKLPELEPLGARIAVPGEDEPRYEGEIMMFAVGNGRRTGAGSLLTADADLSDGELDVLVVPGMNWVDFVALAPRLRAGDHANAPEVLYFRTDRLVVESDDPLAVNADGEPIAADRFEYSVLSDALTVRVP